MFHFVNKKKIIQINGSPVLSAKGTHYLPTEMSKIKKNWEE